MNTMTPEEFPSVFLVAQELWLDQGAPHHELREAFSRVDWSRDQDMDGAEPIDFVKVQHEVRTMADGELETLCCGEQVEIEALAASYPETHRCAAFLFETLFA